jgi:hypothetical protein
MIFRFDSKILLRFSSCALSEGPGATRLDRNLKHDVFAIFSRRHTHIAPSKWRDESVPA